MFENWKLKREWNGEVKEYESKWIHIGGGIIAMLEKIKSPKDIHAILMYYNSEQLQNHHDAIIALMDTVDHFFEVCLGEIPEESKKLRSSFETFYHSIYELFRETKGAWHQHRSAKQQISVADFVAGAKKIEDETHLLSNLNHFKDNRNKRIKEAKEAGFVKLKSQQTSEEPEEKKTRRGRRVQPAFGD